MHDIIGLDDLLCSTYFISFRLIVHSGVVSVVCSVCSVFSVFSFALARYPLRSAKYQ